MSFDHAKAVANSQQIAKGHASPHHPTTSPADNYALTLSALRTLKEAAASVPAFAHELEDVADFLADPHGVPAHVAADPPHVAPKSAPVPVDNAAASENSNASLPEGRHRMGIDYSAVGDEVARRYG
jgi:hypothetical protein